MWVIFFFKMKNTIDLLKEKHSEQHQQECTHFISLDFYSLEDVRRIVETPMRLSLSEEVKAKIKAGEDFVRKKGAENIYIYGVNTGFGALCETRVENEEMEELQRRHVVSHAAGVGPLVSEHLSRYTFFIKLLTLRHGNTGISLRTVQYMCDLWNAGIIPTIPKKGSVGASGDLAPLAHMALPLIGLGSVHFKGEINPAKEVLEQQGFHPIKLKPKEGLALTNGVQYINANATQQLITIGELIKCADVLTAMSAQAYSAANTFYQKLYHETAYHEERREMAANLRTLLEDSNHWQLPTCNKSKQDPYSFRCSPQVHGAVRQTYNFAFKTITNEINGCSDNPLFFPEHDTILFGGNLHGESSAFALDFLAIALTELSNISERRTYLLLSGTRGLPDFLIAKPGLNSGLMIAQYTSAALLNENKVLTHPASADTIPTCQLQEDHVSMGATSAYKLQTIIENTQYIFAIELLHACQAIDFNFKNGLKLSKPTKAVYEAFRTRIPFLDTDRIIADDINKACAFLKENQRSWATELDLS